MPQFSDDLFLGPAQTYMGTGQQQTEGTYAGSVSGTTLTITQLLSGDVLGRGVTRFKDRMDAYRTRLYFIGDGAKWTEERKRADEVFSRFQQELKSLRQQRATR